MHTEDACRYITVEYNKIKSNPVYKPLGFTHKKELNVEKNNAYNMFLVKWINSTLKKFFWLQGSKSKSF